MQFFGYEVMAVQHDSRWCLLELGYTCIVCAQIDLIWVYTVCKSPFLGFHWLNYVKLTSPNISMSISLCTDFLDIPSCMWTSYVYNIARVQTLSHEVDLPYRLKKYKWKGAGNATITFGYIPLNIHQLSPRTFRGKRNESKTTCQSYMLCWL